MSIPTRSLFQTQAGVQCYHLRRTLLSVPVRCTGSTRKCIKPPCIPTQQEEHAQSSGKGTANALHEGPLQDASASAAEAPQSWYLLLQEIADGSLFTNAKRDFPMVPWGPAQLAQMLLLTTCTLLPAAAFTTPGLVSFTPSQTAADIAAWIQQWMDALGADGPLQTGAWMHLGRELGLLTATAAALTSVLRASNPRSTGLFSYRLTASWVMATSIACVVLFPVADPVLVTASRQLLAGAQIVDPFSDAGSGLASTIREITTQQDWQALQLHTLASGLIGPLWEETFWRGFFLTSLTKVLPLSVCVLLSSTWFALLHLTPTSFLSIWLLAAASDILYLRTASLGPPLLLHAAWNTSQILAVAFLGKDAFV